MNQTHESLPDRPLKRFVIGFSAAGAVGFIVTLLCSDTFSEGFIFAPIAMVVVGTISGIISTFGKKALQAILTFAGQIISNP